jgi:hypothetical protein
MTRLSIRGSRPLLLVLFLLFNTRSVYSQNKPSSQPSSGPTDLPPKLPCPQCVPTVDGWPSDGENDHPQKPTCGMQPGWLCCNDKTCRAGLYCSTDRVITPHAHGTSSISMVRTCKVIKQAQPLSPLRPKEVSQKVFQLSGGIFGAKTDDILGDQVCPNQMRRTQCNVSNVQGVGNCYANGWMSNSAADCRCKVHLGAAALQSVSCTVSVVAK